MNRAYGGAAANVPHFTGKHTVERMIASLDIPATTLRSAYFMQNEYMVQQAIQDYGVYPMPIGSADVSMIHTRDIADQRFATTEPQFVISVSRSGRQRNCEEKRTADSQPGLYPDIAPMRLDDTFRDVEPKPRPQRAAGPGLPISIEDRVHHVRCYSLSGIGQ